jgi:hypothetical protein
MINYFFTGICVIAQIFIGMAGVILLAIFPIIIWGITGNASWSWLYCIHFFALIMYIGFEEHADE